MTPTAWTYDDGGRSAAGFKGKAGDCVCRAIAIATERPYSDVYDELNRRCKPYNERRKARGKTANAGSRTGVPREVYEPLLLEWGWRWTPTMRIGQGCTVHLRADELPIGRLVVSVSRHICAVVDGVVHDTYEDSRDGTRCVYGYYQPTTDDTDE